MAFNICHRRLVRNIRTADDISSTGVLQREWDIRLEDQDTLFRDDLREASGIGKRKRKQVKCFRFERIRLYAKLWTIMQRERRVGPVLSHQVRTLIGQGNQAYIDNNLAEVIRVMQEVIRIEPRAIPAWTVLAQCYEDKSEPQKALQLRIMAAHLRRDFEEWERLARQSR